MKKANPTVVGTLACGVCSAEMEVRERSNGKKLLYTYCPNCKADQRTSNQIQAFWRDNMVKPGEPLPSATQLPVTIQPKKPVEREIEEWAPVSELTQENQSESESSDLSNTEKLIGGVVCAFLLIFGIKTVIGAPS